MKWKDILFVIISYRNPQILLPTLTVLGELIMLVTAVWELPDIAVCLGEEGGILTKIGQTFSFTRSLWSSSSLAQHLTAQKSSISFANFEFPLLGPVFKPLMKMLRKTDFSTDARVGPYCCLFPILKTDH